MDQYVSWGLTKDELKLETIWSQCEEFCKPQSNEVHARFDLLTSFCQGSRSVDEWYNCVQSQINLAKYPPQTAKILHRDIFWFFLHDEEFMSKTINKGSVDLDKFPARKVHQLAKKYESSKGHSARRQLGSEAKKLGTKTKNENLSSHDLHLGQDIMMQDPASKQWSPAVITRLCKEPRSYQVTTSDNVTYRKMQAHLKPYKPEIKSAQDVKSCNMWPLEKTSHKTKSNDTIANS